MPEVTVGFAGGDTSVDKVIEWFSHGEDVDISHAFIMLFDSTYESTGKKEESDPYPGVWLHNPQKFIDDSHAKFVTIDVPDIEAGKELARQLLGTPYGYTDCLRTGIEEIIGKSVPDNDYTMHCSETVTRILRAMGVNVCPELEPGDISPVRLYKSIIEMRNV
jgi:hypothetical protein